MKQVQQSNYTYLSGFLIDTSAMALTGIIITSH